MDNFLKKQKLFKLQFISLLADDNIIIEQVDFDSKIESRPDPNIPSIMGNYLTGRSTITLHINRKK